MTIDSNTDALFGAPPPPVQNKSNTVEFDKEAAWKGEFRDMLDKIRDKGFGGYAEEIRVKKLEEMREKILEAMGLNEESLAEMSTEQRAIIERVVNREIHNRLAAERALDDGDPLLNVTANGVGVPVDETHGQAILPQNAGPGLALLQIIEGTDQAEADPTPEDKKG